MRQLQLSSQQIAVPGILGGMGPLAHIEFEQQLIQKNLERGSSTDQAHPVWILVNASNIPDRTKSLTGDCSDCVPWLLHYGRLLERCGVDFMIVTCNTSHAFYDRVQPSLNVPWIHLMAQTVDFIRVTYPQVRRVGVLATDGTLRAELYNRSLIQAGLMPIVPMLGSEVQQQIMQSIYHPDWGIKHTGILISEQAIRSLQISIGWLQQQGAELIIAGCTELSVALARMQAISLPWVDPLEVAASLTMDLAFGRRSLQSIWAA
ncbi:aspartate/glutamate racemase family protein [Leptolyngbya ohadii]|uniref:aspartate/glutamate racemase family protein n=1 Tax=Leptolyngbya ohadii TaxID=1962290 RepID=UPI001CED3356|nr:amino acid racemase [Leptolyngbya ohadii]